MAKTKQELIDSICSAIDGMPIMHNPEHVENLGTIAICFGKDIENRIRTVLGRLGEDGLARIAEHCRSRTAEFKNMQERHSRDIRGLKDTLAGNRFVQMLNIYPADIHVVSERPLLFGMTMICPDGPVCFSMASTDQILGFVEDTGNQFRESSLFELPHNSNRCPVCGSTWQVFDDAPVVHCARCNANWVLFTKRHLGCDCVLDPVSIDLRRGAMSKREYLENTGYTVSNKDTLAKIKRAISEIDGDKEVELNVASGKYDGWFMPFKCVDGVIENEPHFDECVDTALRSCNFSHDGYTGKKLDEMMSLLIRVPVNENTGLDDLAETSGSYDQPECDLYAIAMAAGHVFAMDAATLKKSYGSAPNDNFKDLAKLCPWLDGVASVEGRLMDSDGDTLSACQSGKRRKELVN